MGLKVNRFFVLMLVVLLSCGISACEKEQLTEEAKIEPPVRAYVITARIDKKGTNSTSDGIAVLKGTYDEQSKVFTYAVEYENINPALVTLRSGVKGSAGELIREIYKYNIQVASKQVLSGSFTLTPLQERNLLKGLWFVAISTNITATPEISGNLTLKQK
jgi:hypothetical protein